MKILCVIQRFFPVVGGAENTIEKLMDYLSQKHEVTVITTDAKSLDSFWEKNIKTVKNTSKKGYKIHRYKILTPNSVPENLFVYPLSISSPGPFCPEMWNDLLNSDEKFDLIITSSFPYDHVIPAFVAAKQNKIPIITIPFLHTEFPEYYLTGPKVAILSESDAIVVKTNAEKQTLQNLGILTEKIHTIPEGIELEFEPEKKENLRKKLKIEENSTIVLFVGTMSFEKGIISLIESLKILWERSKKIELILIGTSTKRFENYFSKTEKKFLKHIHNLGQVSDQEKWDAFSSCDIFAMPSKSESFGLVYLEAWRFQKPVIGCDIPSVRNVIDDGKNGILVKFDNTQNLSKSIEKLEDPKIRQTLGNNGYQKLIASYDFKKICKQYEDLCLSFQ